jgi:predicted DCC family thiol-disulfide oxidoreductase YuxK
LSPAEAAASSSEIPTPLILFDGVCNLCNWSVQFLAPRDRNGVLWFAAMQSAAGRIVLEGHDLSADDL